MAQNYVTIYNPDGEDEVHLRANAVDLTRHCGYTWQPGKKLKPVDPAPIPKEEDDGPDLSENPKVRQRPKIDILRDKASAMGITIRSNWKEDTIEKKIAEAVADGAKEPAVATTEAVEEGDEDSDEEE